MKVVTLTIDGVEVRAKRGTKILWVALDNGIYIPHLCAVREAGHPYAGCRLCQVEIDGYKELVTACSEPAVEGMVVRSNSPWANRVRRTAFQLILSNHPVTCSVCFANGLCELQVLSHFLRVPLRQRRFRYLPHDYPVDDSHPLFVYNPNLCVLCGKCVWVCNERGNGALNFAFRGMETMVTTFDGIPLKDAGCGSCAECVVTCPVGALVPKAIKTLIR